MKITKNTDFSTFDKSAGIDWNHDFCPEMCSLSPEEHICTDFRPYISICTFFRNFKKSIDFSPKKHRGKNEIGRFWLVKCSKQYHNYVGRSNILSCFLCYNDGCMAHLLHIHICPFVFCQIHKNNTNGVFFDLSWNFHFFFLKILSSKSMDSQLSNALSTIKKEEKLT